MRQNRSFLSLILSVVFLAACAPSASQSNSSETLPVSPVTVESRTTPVVDMTATPFSAGGLTSPTPQAIATSRGPNLEATDPTSVSLASGGVQFIEFFRFT